MKWGEKNRMLKRRKLKQSHKSKNFFELVIKLDFHLEYHHSTHKRCELGQNIYVCMCVCVCARVCGCAKWL